MVHEYSPLPRSMYELQGAEDCDVRAIGRLERAQATWNLYWLSAPALDLIPGSGEDWWKVYTPSADVAASLALDVAEDEVLYRKLMMHPQAFGAWFEREDLTQFSSYALMGCEQWRTIAMARACEAMERMRLGGASVLGRTRNVVYANFGRQVA
jgi:hypothetical protein